MIARTATHAGPAVTPVHTTQNRTRIKICGITNANDALRAATLGADAVGFIFTDSPRRVSLDQAADVIRALPPFVMTVGVFRNQASDEVNRIIRATRVHAAQLHGDESPATCAAIERPVIKRFDVRSGDDSTSMRSRINQYNVAGHLLDPGAGDGRPFNWTLARNLSHRLILAGGLTADNVAEAIAVAAPFAVDVCSGVEREPGIKDHASLIAFIQEVRRHDADANRS